MASLSPGGTVALGVVVGLISTCVQSVGLTLQRKSHILEDEKEEHIPRRAPYRRRRWQIGMSLFLLSNIVGSSIQITTLPLPLLSTLQASGLVFNALLASLILHEPFTRRTAFGTLLVTAGAVLISFFSALPEPSHTLSQLLELLVVPNFVIWMSMTILLVVLVLAGTFLINHLLPAGQRHTHRVRLIRGMSYGLISGILSAHALLLAKSAVELLVRTIVDHSNQFNRYQSWLLLLLFLFLALTQLYYLHHGLKLVTTSILYPFVFCIYNIIAIMDGLIYFRQMDRLAPLHAGLIALGTIVLLTGVLALSWRLSEEEPSAAPDTPTTEITRHRRGTMKMDLPQSALTPGMGFVNEDDTGAISSPHLLSYDTEPADEDADENAPLLRRHTMRDSALIDAKKRKRRSTIREVADIWDELRDEENHYDTLALRDSNGTYNDRRSDVKRSQRPRSYGTRATDPDSSTLPPVAATPSRSKTAPPRTSERRRQLPTHMGNKGKDTSHYRHSLPPTTHRSDTAETDGEDETSEREDAAKKKGWAGSIRLSWFRSQRQRHRARRKTDIDVDARVNLDAGEAERGRS